MKHGASRCRYSTGIPLALKNNDRAQQRVYQAMNQRNASDFYTSSFKNSYKIIFQSIISIYTLVCGGTIDGQVKHANH